MQKDWGCTDQSDLNLEMRFVEGLPEVAVRSSATNHYKGQKSYIFVSIPHMMYITKLNKWTRGRVREEQIQGINLERVNYEGGPKAV